MESFLKLFMPVYLVLYIVVAFVVPSFRIWKRTGINPVTFGKEDNAHNYIGFVMKMLIILLFVAVLSFSFGSKIYPYFLPAHYLQHKAVYITGLILIHISLLWIIIAQFQMSSSWRIGIDEVNKTELVTKGIFSISRNPIFLGMIVSVCGVFCIVPNALTFFISASTYFIIQIQIRLEENFLERQHGEKYRAYKRSTRRLI
jgi:protein-S-isoprenylcysteine O-methyltransferase Ste14